MVGCVARFRNGCNIFRKNVSKGKCRMGGEVKGGWWGLSYNTKKK